MGTLGTRGCVFLHISKNKCYFLETRWKTTNALSNINKCTNMLNQYILELIYTFCFILWRHNPPKTRKKAKIMWFVVRCQQIPDLCNQRVFFIIPYDFGLLCVESKVCSLIVRTMREKHTLPQVLHLCGRELWHVFTNWRPSFTGNLRAKIPVYALL